MQLLTTEQVAEIWQYDKRTISAWTSRKKSARISFVRVGHEKRFLWKDVFEHILAHRVEAERGYPHAAYHGASSPLRLMEEDIQRIERLIQLCVKAEVGRFLQSLSQTGQRRHESISL